MVIADVANSEHVRRTAERSAVRTSDTKEIEHPQRMAGLEKLQRGARRRDEGPLWAGRVIEGTAGSHHGNACRPYANAP